jgi:hypothetical protein
MPSDKDKDTIIPLMEIIFASLCSFVNRDFPYGVPVDAVGLLPVILVDVADAINANSAVMVAL